VADLEHCENAGRIYPFYRPIGVYAGFSYELPSTHCYTMAVRPGAHTTFEALSVCVNDVARWFLENACCFSTLTRQKQLLFGTLAQRKKIPTAGGIDVTGAVVPFYKTDHK